MLATSIHKNAQRALGVELEVPKILCGGWGGGAAVEENEVWVEKRGKSLKMSGFRSYTISLEAFRVVIVKGYHICIDMANAF